MLPSVSMHACVYYVWLCSLLCLCSVSRREWTHSVCTKSLSNLNVWSHIFISFIIWSDTDEELKEWKTKFEERIAILEKKISKLEREIEDNETKSSFLEQSIKDYIWEISKLETEAAVKSMRLHTFHFLEVQFCISDSIFFPFYFILFFLFCLRLMCPWKRKEIQSSKNYLRNII